MVKSYFIIHLKKSGTELFYLLRLYPPWRITQFSHFLFWCCIVSFNIFFFVHLLLSQILSVVFCYTLRSKNTKYFVIDETIIIRCSSTLVEIKIKFSEENSIVIISHHENLLTQISLESGFKKLKTPGFCFTGFFIIMEIPSDINGLLKSITRSRSDVIVMDAIAISASYLEYKKKYKEMLKKTLKMYYRLKQKIKNKKKQYKYQWELNRNKRHWYKNKYKIEQFLLLDKRHYEH